MAKAAACSLVSATRSTWPLVVVLLLVVLLVVDAHLLEDHDDAVELFVVGDADGAHHPLELLGAVEVEVLGQVPGAAQLLDDAPEVAGQHCDLLLLDLDRRLGQALAAVEEEEAVADLADDADGAVVGCVEIDARRSRRHQLVERAGRVHAEHQGHPR